MLAGWLNSEQQKAIEYLREANKVRCELLRGKRIRLSHDQRRRLAVKGRELGRKALEELGCLVTPDTILRWYRSLIAKMYDGSKNRGPGRPRKDKEIEELVVRMATENAWGYTRIRDAMRHLGHELGRTTVQRILKEHGIEPAHERRRRTSWKEFLSSHWEALAACDFFTVEVLTLWGLVRYHVFFVMQVATRKVQIAGIVHEPHEAWMMQVGRNRLDCFDGFLEGMRYLIIDRDPVFTPRFRGFLERAGVKPVRLPSRSPDLNPHAERFVLSARSECLNRLVLLGERHLRSSLQDFVDHYHTERPHQGLGGRLIEFPPTESRAGPIVCRERQGGLLRYYHRKAA